MAFCGIKKWKKKKEWNSIITIAFEAMADIIEVVEEVLRDEDAEVLDPEVPGVEAEVPEADKK